MNICKQAVIALRRDWRSGELSLIAVAVLLAVTSLTSVSFFTDRIRRATEIQATELLAADLVLRSSRPIHDTIIDQAAANRLITTLTSSFRSVIVANDKLQMAEVKAVEDAYPIRGQLRTRDSLFGAETMTRATPKPGAVWADPRLVQLLGIQIGDAIRLGAAQFTVARILSYEPDRGGDIFNIAPRLLMNRDDVPATKLILPGSRVRYHLLVGGRPDDVSRFREQIESLDDEHLQVQGIRDARPELKTALERAEQFLGLAALVSIALAGLAIAMSAQRYARRHFDHCAIMRCLGAEQKTLNRLYLMQMLILSLLSSMVGILLGFLAQQALAGLAAGLTKDALPGPSVYPVFYGLLVGTVTTVGFAMPQIQGLSRISPLRVLRRDLLPTPPGGLLTYGMAISTLAFLTPWQSGNIQLTMYTFIGLILTVLMLFLVSKRLIRSLSRLRAHSDVAFRHGLSNIERRARLSVAQIIGIGSGVMVMLLLALIRSDLLENWRERLPEGTPNYFLINIQADEVPALRSFLQRDAELTTALYPMIRGRLVAINGLTVNPSAYPNERAQRLAAREFNLSWAKNMQVHNRLLQGSWWQGGEEGTLFSVEEGIAETLGIELHDTLTYNIGGQVLSGQVTNIREVDWDSFQVNFFVIANPGALDKLPGTYITSVYLPTEKQHLLMALLASFPSVTIFDIDALISQVRVIMQQVIRTMEFVFSFTLLTGFVVLLAALQTTHDERRRESALLCALGASRRQILAMLTAEFLCIGLIAGFLAAVSATLVECMLARFVFNLAFTLNLWVWLLAPLICTMVVLAAGLISTYKVLHTPPIVALRNV